MENKDKIKWPPGFANALKLEFYDNKNDLEYSEEVLLNKEAIKMDMLANSSVEYLSIHARIIFSHRNRLQASS